MIHYCKALGFIELFPEAHVMTLIRVNLPLSQGCYATGSVE